MTQATAIAPAIETHPPRAAGKRKVLLLGPQRGKPTLRDRLQKHGFGGRLAVVTAGWQDRESDLEELSSHLGHEPVALELYRRSEEVFAADPDLAEVHHARQEELRRTQRLYDLRLEHAMDAAAELERRQGTDATLLHHRERALEAVRQLDAEHVARVREIHAQWDPKLDLARRPAVKRAREELRELLVGCDGLAISGGHVAALLNRLRLFDVLGALPEKAPIVGWSGGAIVLTERVVVYHDAPPQGPGNAEILETGLGVAKSVAVFPHAARRLRLEDAPRVSRLAHRLAPATCLALDDGGSVLLTPRGCKVDAGVRVLGTDGRVEEMT